MVDFEKRIRGMQVSLTATNGMQQRRQRLHFHKQLCYKNGTCCRISEPRRNMGKDTIYVPNYSKNDLLSSPPSNGMQ